MATKLKGRQVEQFTSISEGVVPSSGGGTSAYLRADGTWSVPAGGGGGAIITEVEVNFGIRPTRGTSVLVNVVGMTTANKVQVWLSGNQATGKGSDELTVDCLSLAAKANNGNFELFMASSTLVKGKYKIYYTYQ